jgi:hypothetical protein
MRPVPERAFTDAELEAAIDALAEPNQFREAQALVERAAPQLQKLLGLALEEGGWFDEAHDSAVAGAALTAEEHERITAVRTLLAEEARIGMMVGVAVGYELARRLRSMDTEEET